MLFALIASRRYLVGDLIRTAKKLPSAYKDAKARAADPAAEAKPANDPPERPSA